LRYLGCSGRAVDDDGIVESCRHFVICSAYDIDCLDDEGLTDLAKGVIVILTKHAGPVIIFTVLL
jgi:hypothetical protein